jgi:hypothetical protein
MKFSFKTGGSGGFPGCQINPVGTGRPDEGRSADKHFPDGLDHIFGAGKVHHGQGVGQFPLINYFHVSGGFLQPDGTHVPAINLHEIQPF